MGARSPLLGGLEVSDIQYVPQKPKEETLRKLQGAKENTSNPDEIAVTLEQVQEAERTKTLKLLLDRSPKATINLLNQKYKDRLENALRYFAKDVYGPEDIVQEAFLRAYQQHHHFKEDAAFYTWIYRIAMNVSISFNRKKRGTVGIDEEILSNAGLELDQSTLQGIEHLLRIENIGIVRAVLNNLTPEHREVLMLRHEDDMPYDIMAEILGIPVGTVRSRLCRARLEFKSMIIGTALGTDLPKNNTGNYAYRKKERKTRKSIQEYAINNFLSAEDESRICLEPNK